MATTFFFLDAASDVATADSDKALSTSRGGSAVSKVTNTVAGAVTPGTTAPPVTDGAGGATISWFSQPLAAVTITPSLSTNPTANLRGLESATQANATLQADVWQVDSAGNQVGVSPIWLSKFASRAELGTSEGALNFTPAAADAFATTTITAGNRLRFRVYLDDATGVTMGSGRTVTFFYNGPTGGASGDSFITFSETIGIYVPTPYRIPYTQLLAQ